jgi:hypothetical protein
VHFNENQICIFDVTVPEMVEAFVQGCDFFHHLLFSGSIGDIPETSFLAASIAELGYENFTMRIIESGETINHRHPANDFTIFADAGMFSPFKNMPRIYVVSNYFLTFYADRFQGIRHRKRSFGGP